jgi:hypothetical protein
MPRRAFDRLPRVRDPRLAFTGDGQALQVCQDMLGLGHRYGSLRPSALQRHGPERHVYRGAHAVGDGDRIGLAEPARLGVTPGDDERRSVEPFKSGDFIFVDCGPSDRYKLPLVCSNEQYNLCSFGLARNRVIVVHCEYALGIRMGDRAL